MIALGLLANIVVMWFSRQREFRADAGGAKLSGAPGMIAALQRLFMSHPPIPERIAALRTGRYS